jgi:hypothetical protein
MIEGSGSVPLTIEYGSRRLKNIQILRIRIRNTGSYAYKKIQRLSTQVTTSACLPITRKQPKKVGRKQSSSCRKFLRQVGTVPVSLRRKYFQIVSFAFKDIVQPKRGGQEGYQSIRPAFLHNRRYFFI